MQKIEKAIESLIDLLQEINARRKNDALLNDVPGLVSGIEKALHRLHNGEKNVWELVGDLTIHSTILDEFPPNGGSRLKINVTKTI